MGARPVAVVDPLRFGAADHPDTKRVLPGVVAGIGGYGNCLGLPNIGGEVVFDACYQGNPLVNAGAIGVMRHEDIHLAKASGPGNKVILYGARTGGDGIGGVSDPRLRDLRRRQARPSAPPSRSATPSRRSCSSSAPWRSFAEKLVVGIQDLGGAGLSCATSELASAGSGGMRVELDDVPLRDSTLSPEEILMSESQERMCAVVEPEKVDRFLEICEKWDVIATVIGEVTDGDRLEIFWHGEQIVDVDAAHRRPRGPGLRAPVRPPGLAGRAPGRRRGQAAAARRPPRSCAQQVLAAGLLARTRRPSPGSPTSTTASCRATPCWPSPRTPA